MPILFQFSMSLAGLEITRKKPGDLGWDGTYLWSGAKKGHVTEF